MDTILRTESLCKNFGNITAVDNLSFSVQRGEIVGILGPNGSGKTTTLSIVLSIRKPTSGSFSWFNGVTGSAANRRIGSILEIPYFYPYLNLFDNLKITAVIRGVDEKMIYPALEEVNLLNRIKSQYITLSLGMKQRLALACALLGNPEVLVLDEPTNGLDPEGIAEVRDLIKQQGAKGKTIILASHILDEVEKVCSNVLILKKGKCIASGKVSELISTSLQFVIETDDAELLPQILSQNPNCKLITTEKNLFTVSLNPDYSPSMLNKWLLERDVSVNRLEPKRNSLESQFLELIRGENHSD